MGKPTGFKEFSRKVPADREPMLRVLDWKEFHEHLPEVDLKIQGARCMDCGVPFCHTGDMMANMASGCPINNLIPEWNDLVYRGLWKDALDRLHKTNNFPEFTGRICPAPCEAACTLNINDDAVGIKSIEHAIIDKAWENHWVKPLVSTQKTNKLTTTRLTTTKFLSIMFNRLRIRRAERLLAAPPSGLLPFLCKGDNQILIHFRDLTLK